MQLLFSPYENVVRTISSGTALLCSLRLRARGIASRRPPPPRCSEHAGRMMVATGALPAPAVAFRTHAAKRTPTASQPRHRACPLRAAAGESAVCPVIPASHAEPTPTGRPNVALRPVSELAVSSSKALEAFKASGAASRASAPRRRRGAAWRSAARARPPRRAAASRLFHPIQHTRSDTSRFRQATPPSPSPPLWP